MYEEVKPTRELSALRGDNGARFFGPEDVLDKSDLTIEEKREILASWASDARAVENAPSLRQLETGRVIGVDEILMALQSLDAETLDTKADKLRDERTGGILKRPTRRRNPVSKLIIRRNERPDDDDDPPPAPAGTVIPMPPSPPLSDVSYADSLSSHSFSSLRVA